MSKRIYITGILGLLGANLEAVLKRNYSIHGFDRNECPNKPYSKIDASNFDKVKEDIVRYKPDYIIHALAMINIDACEVDHKLACELNVELTEKLCGLASELGAKLIFISTDAVFDGTDKKLYDEEDELHPINYYGQTKAQAEQVVMKYRDNLVLRTNIYGINIREKLSFGEWIVDALMKDKTLTMFTDVRISPILAQEFAEIVRCIINKDDLAGIYHLAGSGSISKYDFGIYLKEVFGIETGEILPISVDDIGLKALRGKELGLNNDKISRELEVHIRSPRESIDEFYRLYKNNYKEYLKGDEDS